MTDEVRFWRWDDLPGLELSEAILKSRAYPRAYLLNYTFGVRVSGHRKTTYRGKTFTTGESFSVYQPGEVLASKPSAGDLWRYQNLSLTPEALTDLLNGASGGKAPNFPLMVTPDAKRDGALRALFSAAFESLTRGEDSLEQEVTLLRLLLSSIVHLADTSIKPSTPKQEHRAVQQVKDALKDGLTKRIILDDLAHLTGLSKWHLLRVFKREVGVSPDVYKMSLRVQEAQRLLHQGHTLRRVALLTGFHDRSHFRRTFKRYALVAPSVYQRGVR